jgi:hypothetical protein
MILSKCAFGRGTDGCSNGAAAMRHPLGIKRIFNTNNTIALIGFDRSRGGQAVFAEGVSLKRFHGFYLPYYSIGLRV